MWAATEHLRQDQGSLPLKHGTAHQQIAQVLASSLSRVPVSWDSPNLEGQVAMSTLLKNRVALLYPRALGYLHVASYESKSDGPAQLHTIGPDWSHSPFAAISQYRTVPRIASDLPPFTV
jgi:hypothetical protein